MHSCPCAMTFPIGQERTEDGTFVYFPHKIGKSTLVCGRRSSHFPYHIFWMGLICRWNVWKMISDLATNTNHISYLKLIVGPEWPCMIVTYGLIIVPTVFFLINVAALLSPITVAIGCLSTVFTLWYYSATACSDPGIVFLYAEPALIGTYSASEEHIDNRNEHVDDRSECREHICDNRNELRNELRNERNEHLTEFPMHAIHSNQDMSLSQSMNQNNGNYHQTNGNSNNGDNNQNKGNYGNNSLLPGQDSIERTASTNIHKNESNGNANNSSSLTQFSNISGAGASIPGSGAFRGQNGISQIIHPGQIGQTGHGIHGHNAVNQVSSPALMECGQCSVNRPITAAHCYECGLCVDQLDHHCPWTGKCIAKKNLRSFRLFLAFLCFHITFVVAVCIYALIMKLSIFTMNRTSY